MRKFVFLLTFLSFSAPIISNAASLDDIYRDIVQSDNQGYLPMFVKNRSALDLMEDEIELPSYSYENPAGSGKPTDPVILINKRKLRDEEIARKKQRWDNAINAVKENRITPMELEEIESQALQENPKAVETLAWMYANGVGVTQDLVKSFTLYQKAARMSVPNSAENALLVYRSMSPTQKEELNAFRN